MKSKNGLIDERRRRAYARLENQLKDGVKRSKNSNEEIPLNEKDIERITKEISILKTRIR